MKIIQIRRKINIIFKEFKEFISKGNVIDLAVGVIIGGAFGKIVTSFVDDMIMPVLGILLGKVNFSTLRVIITPATESKAESAILYGNFIQNVVNFLIMAFILFIMIKFINKLRKPKTEEVVATVVEPTKEEKLLAEIRDILKNKQ